MIRRNVNGVPMPGIKSASNRGKRELNNRGARRRLPLPVVKKLLLLLSASEKKRLLLK
jgi:hypothetical protein